MVKYRKKPVIVEATQWFKNGDHPAVVAYAFYDSASDRCAHCGNTMHVHGWIDTLEVWHIVCPGDFIITGIALENYPCKSDIFEQTYEAV